jgi:protein gp37
MGAKTGIEWTDATWNPVTGCTKVSAGCKFCYAERDFHRPYPERDFSDVRCHPDRLSWPLRWRGSKQAKAEGRRSRIFVNSMSDLFHESVPFEFIDKVCGMTHACAQHTFQILTKRPIRMVEYDYWRAANNPHAPAWPSNVWLGVSVEDQKTADERIPLLIQTPAAVRFVSYEPALGPVDFSPYFRYDPVHGNKTQRRVCLSGSEVGRPPNYGRWDSLEDSEARVGSLEEMRCEPIMQAGESRTRLRGIPSGPRDDRREEGLLLGGTADMASFQRSNSRHSHCESQGREKEKKPLEQSGTGDQLRATETCRENLEGRTCLRSERPQEFNGKIDHQASTRDTESPRARGETGDDSAGLRDQISRGIKNSPWGSVGLNLIIAGGESGPHARPAHPDWFRAIRDQCQAAGVPFFFKQWGEWLPADKHMQGMWPEKKNGRPITREWWPSVNWGSGLISYRVSKQRAGRLLDGREWNEFPEG